MSIEVVEYGDKEEGSYMDLGCRIADALSRAYPRHPWQVCFQGGSMIVRHETINAFAASALKREGFGFLLPKNKLGHNKEIVRSAVMAGGAVLELFGFPRGAWDGERLPEVPKDWKIKQERDFA